MPGTIALVGGGEFRLTADVDRELVDRAETNEVVVLPTAAAFEHPDHAIAAAMSWFEPMGLDTEARMVLTRRDAFDPQHVDAVSAGRFIYLVGGSPLHLRSVLKDTPVWEAIRSVLDRGGVVAASGSCAAAVCDPMTDPRGGAFTLGLGLVPSIAVVPEAELKSEDRLHRTLKLAIGFPVVVLPSGTALLRDDSGWTRIGDVEVHGTLTPR
jgi:cyanophycinase